MARMFGRYRMLRTPLANPETLFQIRVAANIRVVLSSAEIIPLGSTGASVPLMFEWQQQNTNGAGFADDSTVIEKVEPACVEAFGGHLSIWKRTGAGAEPTEVAGGHKDIFGSHQQQPRIWVPRQPYNEDILPGGAAGSNWGLVFVGAVPSFGIQVTLRFEV